MSKSATIIIFGSCLVFLIGQTACFFPSSKTDLGPGGTLATQGDGEGYGGDGLTNRLLIAAVIEALSKLETSLRRIHAGSGHDLLQYAGCWTPDLNANLCQQLQALTAQQREFAYAFLSHKTFHDTLRRTLGDLPSAISRFHESQSPLYLDTPSGRAPMIALAHMREGKIIVNTTAALNLPPALLRQVIANELIHLLNFHPSLDLPGNKIIAGHPLDFDAIAPFEYTQHLLNAVALLWVGHSEMTPNLLRTHPVFGTFSNQNGPKLRVYDESQKICDIDLISPIGQVSNATFAYLGFGDTGLPRFATSLFSTWNNGLTFYEFGTDRKCKVISLVPETPPQFQDQLLWNIGRWAHQEVIGVAGQAHLRFLSGYNLKWYPETLPSTLFHQESALGIFPLAAGTLPGYHRLLAWVIDGILNLYDVVTATRVASLSNVPVPSDVNFYSLHFVGEKISIVKGTRLHLFSLQGGNLSEIRQGDLQKTILHINTAPTGSADKSALYALVGGTHHRFCKVDVESVALADCKDLPGL